MIVEYIRYTIPADQHLAFMAAYRHAAESLRVSPVCLAYELTRCEEAPDQHTLRIEWTSTEDHLHGFRRSPEFAPFFKAIHPFIPQIAEMRHYTPTDLTWRR
jgi:quinol monooxygenase YgiN